MLLVICLHQGINQVIMGNLEHLVTLIIINMNIINEHQIAENLRNFHYPFIPPKLTFLLPQYYTEKMGPPSRVTLWTNTPK